VPSTCVAFALSLVAAALASAQTIAPVDYLPLGQGFQWQFTRTAGGGPSDLHLEVTDVNVADSGTRYLLDVPSTIDVGFRLEYATDGTLRLRALEANLNALLDGLPLDPTAIANVQFMPPVVLGAPTVTLGSATVATPVDTTFEAELDTNIGSASIDVHTTGTITASWDTTSAVTTPGGSFGDVVLFTLDVSLAFSEDRFDTSGSLKEHITAVLARGAGFVQIQIGDTAYAFQRAIVGGVPIGDFPQYEDLVSLAFSVTPPLVSLHGRALGDAVAGDVALHGITIAQAIFGKTELNAVLDHPAASGVAVYAKGPSTAKGDGRLRLELDGKSPVGDKKIKFHTAQTLDPTATSFGLNAKVGKTKTVIPISIEPVLTGDVRVSFDGFVDQSAAAGSTRKLSSNGRLVLGDVEYPIVAKETLKVKKNGTHLHTYNVKSVDNLDKAVVHVEAKATSAADFTITQLKPTLYKRQVKKKNVFNVAAEVVQP
jgi:hypothetical protein